MASRTSCSIATNTVREQAARALAAAECSLFASADGKITLAEWRHFLACFGPLEFCYINVRCRIHAATALTARACCRLALSVICELAVFSIDVLSALWFQQEWQPGQVVQEPLAGPVPAAWPGRCQLAKSLLPLLQGESHRQVLHSLRVRALCWCGKRANCLTPDNIAAKHMTTRRRRTTSRCSTRVATSTRRTNGSSRQFCLQISRIAECWLAIAFVGRTSTRVTCCRLARGRK